MSSEPVSRKVFVSYKYLDRDVEALAGSTPGADTGYAHTPRHYVDEMIALIGDEYIYKGEMGNEDISHLADDTIDSRLKEKIFDSSVTIVLISPNVWNKALPVEEQWIPNEVSYSLRNKKRGDKVSKTNGMLAIALPDSRGSYDYAVIVRPCGVRSWQTNTYFPIIGQNMFNRVEKRAKFCGTCFGHHHEDWDHSYIHPVKWHEFVQQPNVYIERAAVLRDRLDEFEIVKTHE